MSSTAPPYSALAVGYDAVMAHVDYEGWAAYVHERLQAQPTPVGRVLELGGGTGTLALHLQPRGDYTYRLTDGAAAMLHRAQHKIDAAGAPISTEQVDFRNVSLNACGLEAPVDAVLCLYDGLNYLLTEDAVADLLAGMARVLRPGGVAVFDQSTPANSEDNADFFVDEGTVGEFAYVRESRYDPETQRHVTTFEISGGGTHAVERHVQRAYAPGTVRRLLDASPLAPVAAYDGFTTDPAHPDSHRVHWIARRPPVEA